MNVNLELANLAFDITGASVIGMDFNAICNEKTPLLLAYEAYVYLFQVRMCFGVTHNLNLFSCLNILYRRRTWVWEKYNIFQNQTLAKQLKLIEEQVTHLIQKRRQEHAESDYRRNDILDILLTKNSETGADEFTDKDIIDQLNSFL